jgi:phosphatidate cytidylyltransferase
MKIRTITAAILLAITVPIMIFSRYVVYPIFLALLALFAVYELLRVMGYHREWWISVPAYMMAVALPLESYFVDEDGRSGYLLAVAIVIFAYLLYLMTVAVFSHGRITISKIGEAFTAVTYVVASFTSLTTVRYLTHGMFCFVLVFITAWVTDSMAYVVGSLIGKHKLIPDVSPKKTIEGAIGGLVLTIIACLLYGYIIESVAHVSANYIVLGVIGAILSVVSQIGDLVASLIKREHGVKDYGKLLPGHGGIMDRFDSILAVSTPLLVICIIYPPFI